MGSHTPEATSEYASVTDAETTGVIYLMPNHPQRRKHRATRRRPRPSMADRLRLQNPLWLFAGIALVLAAVDTLVILYARQRTGSFREGFADIFAVILGLLSGWLS